ncbi:hypothetical protein ACIBM4_09780 [Streptomyces sp. NPDC050256]|uniref:hypothetical protein n=1 Tax=unclassified Streptomyces TaxID=2593676 RepID=UPI003788335B
MTRRGPAVLALLCAALVVGCGAGPAVREAPVAVRAPVPATPSPPEESGYADPPPAPVPRPSTSAQPKAPRASAVPGPGLSRRPPTATAAPTPSRPAATGTTPARAPGTGTGAGTVLRIGDWSARIVRGGQEEIDACREAVQWSGPDFGREDGYKMRTAVVVGHDYCGFSRFATLAVGTRVTVETPRETLTYRVYAHYLTPGRGAPAHGLYWGDLTLQSCVGPDTGFTYLMRM